MKKKKFSSFKRQPSNNLFLPSFLSFQLQLLQNEHKRVLSENKELRKNVMRENVKKFWPRISKLVQDLEVNFFELNNCSDRMKTSSWRQNLYNHFFLAGMGKQR